MAEQGALFQLTRSWLFHGLLWLIIVAGIMVVTQVNHYRMTFAELERVKNQTSEARHEWRRLSIEEQTYSASANVEKLARSTLGMRAPNNSETVVIELPAPGQPIAYPAQQVQQIQQVQP